MKFAEFAASSCLSAGSAPYVEELYEQYLEDPSSVDASWRGWFDQLQLVPAADGKTETRDRAHSSVVKALVERARDGGERSRVSESDLSVSRKQVAVQQLIAAYRWLGNRWADLDPLRRRERPAIPELDPAFYGLSEADMSTAFHASSTFFGRETMELREIIEALRQTYCSKIGAEYMYITDPAQKRWWQRRLESIRSAPSPTREERRHILERLTAAEGLERYLHTRYVGQKRFSLEGGESFIPSMDAVVRKAAESGVEEMIIGMAHRGRLNVLVNTMGKPPADLFAEFEGKAGSCDLPAGDVKYHNGFSSDVATPFGPIHVAMAFNPSHLEAVDPVLVGSVRARQDKRKDSKGDRVLGVMVHGDAAFPGQGVVMETLNLADTRGYGTGGTMHIVINNQIGFTTSDPRDKGSMIYCTDPAKLIEAPVLHVNGDDPEAVVLATELAMDYKREFRRDVVVDIVCFRRLGHNEQDTPAVTQPLMYHKIAKHPGTRALYAERLVTMGAVDAGEPAAMVEFVKERLRQGATPKEMPKVSLNNPFAIDWSPLTGHPLTDEADTRVPLARLRQLGEAITAVPASFALHPLVARVIADRKQMLEGKLAADWGLAEHLAFASLVAAHYPVRISGEDCGRGTFSHRHAVLHDQNRDKWDEGDYVPLQHVSPDQADFTVIDSVLSEEAVLAYEYGYASSCPNGLVLWEAQFGDFANGAQVSFDQFISSGEAKWGRQCGLVVLLPHGYEGQGPEHSSARVERYLQLAAEDNMQICQPSNAKQVFHLLRRQMVRSYRKPLIVFTGKSLLRNKAAACPIEELAEGTFETVIGDRAAGAGAERIVACSGKVYYDLVRGRAERGMDGKVAIVRVEQLYPFPAARLAEEFARYPAAREVVWCQDEPQNQGAWTFVSPRLMTVMQPGQKLAYAGRPESSSPAVGYPARHAEQQKALVEAAFARLKGFVQTR
ncbi:MAG: 2-oxoglutarate dehydrogenase E1 component [Duodenibacillus sp.]|nr:2-oxoglutarate dehydrogenase E1 component [Duodenibacillus sp.]